MIRSNKENASWRRTNPTLRSVPAYVDYADQAEEGEEEDTRVVKGQCTFNQLKAFHCIKQCPPCIGHDFYEGVMAKNRPKDFKFRKKNSKI